jgi:hypothetical protein
MKHLSKLVWLFAVSLTIWSCKQDDDNGPDLTTFTTTEVSNVVTVSGSTQADFKFEAAKKYLLSGFVYVEEGATLTIEPGTVILGDGSSLGTLIIKPGGRIIAEGTAQKPIVFTSSKPKGQRKTGDWGGLVILGKAPVNKPNAVVEGENLSTFGGSDAADNSGVLKYVRIEFAGIALETNREINSLTMGGVGSGTVIDYVQVSYAGDDAYEWFGGTVNAKHLISYRTLDDDFDTDNGYSGKVQYGVILRDPSLADQAGDSNGFESDNDADGTIATPQTSANFANVSVFMAPGSVNGKYRSAMRIRRNSAVSAFNSIFVGGFLNGLELEGPSQANFTSGTSDYRGLVFADMATKLKGVDATRFNDASRANSTSMSESDLMLNANYNTLSGKPSFLPQPGSPILSGGTTLPTGFESTSYKGAFNTADWTEGWTNWDPNNTDY